MTKPIEARRLGFVGVRRGLTLDQFQAVSRIVVAQRGRGSLTGIEVAHRSNNGWAGADFSRITRWMKSVPKLVLHDCGGPEPETPSLSAESMASWADFTIEATSVPPWNREIVDESDVLLACPPIAEEEIRSRTWATIRYARNAGKYVVVVYPDGTVDAGGQIYFLVREGNEHANVLVFLCRDPKVDGYFGMASRQVVLETLLLQERLEAVRPVLGRSPRNPQYYQEFASHRALRKARYEPAGSYRVCDTWEDYHFPWETRLLTAEDENEIEACETNGNDRPSQTDVEMGSVLNPSSAPVHQHPGQSLLPLACPSSTSCK
jgi:hypothetical protein